MGEYRVDRVKLVAGVRVIRLAEVVAGRRRTEKRSRRAECNRHRLKVAVACVGGCCRLKFELDNFDERGLECGSSSAGAESGLSGEEGDRQWIVRRQEEKRVAVAESRRGYAIGAAWDEGNMIQAMAYCTHVICVRWYTHPPSLYTSPLIDTHTRHARAQPLSSQSSVHPVQFRPAARNLHFLRT